MNKYFYRLTDNGNARILHVEDGEAVTRFEEDEYPIGCQHVYPIIGGELSAGYEHLEGIILTVEDAEFLGIKGECTAF
ncbi:MAG: hypothetical protein U9M89_02745 [Patescibacteria group bacterium]|nr:hypothetical protein [Patescibacteria group bacterium]